MATTFLPAVPASVKGRVVAMYALLIGVNAGGVALGAAGVS